MRTKQGLLRGLRFLGVALVAAALLLPTTASSQDVAVGQATATVLGVELSADQQIVEPWL